MRRKVDSDIYEIISKNIKKYRIMLNMSQEELARRANYTYQYIRRIEAPNVKKTFSLSTVYRLSKILRVDIAKMFEVDDSDID